MRKPQRGYARQDRVKEQIMRELAELVRTGLKDPRAGFITINEVEVTRDYSHATVFYTVSTTAPATSPKKPWNTPKVICAASWRNASNSSKRRNCTSNTTNRSNAA